MREAERAVESFPLTEDAVYATAAVYDLALVRLLTGDREGAVTELEVLLGMPSWLSIRWLEFDPRLRELRGNLRLQRWARDRDVRVEVPARGYGAPSAGMGIASSPVVDPGTGYHHPTAAPVEIHVGGPEAETTPGLLPGGQLRAGAPKRSR